MTNLTVPVSSDEFVQIDTVSSDVVITGDEQGQVQVESEGKEGIRLERSEGKTHINAQAAADAVITVRVPPRCRLQVNTVSGDITGRGLVGSLSLATTSGDVTLNEAAGHIHIHNVSGNANISGSVFNGLSVETVSGDIRLSGALEDNGEYSLHTISGDISLGLPADARCLVLYQTLSGDLVCSLPHQVRRQGWGKMEIAVNDGGTALRCSSTSGDLRIQAREAASHEAQAQQAGTPFNSEGANPASPFDLGDEKSQAGQAPGYKTRLEVLKAIEEGQLTVQEGLALLQKLV